LEAASSRDLFFAIVFNHRYARPIQMAHQAVSARQLGEITFALWRFGGEWEPNHPYMTVIESFCHGFDILEYLCGSITSIMCEMTDKTGHGFRSVAIALQFSNGAVGAMIGGYDSSFAYKQTQLLEINGRMGRILVEDTVQSFSFQEARQETRSVWEAGYFNDFSRSFHATLDDYMEATLNAFTGGIEPPVHARYGQRALELAHASIRSFETGQRIVLPA
jgi:predicted dehydrogenase